MALINTLSHGHGDATMQVVCRDIVTDRVQAADKKRESELFRAAEYEIDRHKWFESERAGHDVGMDAVKSWKNNHWWRWCRERLVEHLSGTKYWSELDQKDYGLINRDFHPNRELAQIIVNKIKAGGENLDIIFWARDTKQNMCEVLEILHQLDINSRRISFWQEATEKV